MHSALGVPRQATWDSLQKSRNLAAVATLAQGLQSPNAQLRHACLQSLLLRDEPSAYRAILLNWEKLTEQEVELARRETFRFVEPTTELISSGSLSEKKSALAAIVALDLVHAIDAVIDIAINPRHALSGPASESLLKLCKHWGNLARNGSDVPSVRTPLLERLYYRLALYHEHKNAMLLDAWLYVVHWNDSLHRSVISDSRQDAYRPLLKRLGESTDQPIIQLLAGYAVRPATPKPIVEMLVEGANPQIAVEMAKLADANTFSGLVRKLRQLPPLASLQAIDLEEPTLSFELKKKLWIMLAASSENLPRVLAGAVKLAALGTADGRQTAAEMLSRARRLTLEVFVPALQEARIVSGNSDANLFDLVMAVAGWLQSPSSILRKASQDYFKEFTLANLLESVKTWPMQMCRTMACIVRMTDRNLAEPLSRELQCPSPKRRLAALQVTEMLECGSEVSQCLIPLIDDARLDVRVRAIDVLSALGHESLEELIPNLLADASTDIQDAANRAARRIQRRKGASTSSDSLDVEAI